MSARDGRCVLTGISDVLVSRVLTRVTKLSGGGIFSSSSSVSSYDASDEDDDESPGLRNIDMMWVKVGELHGRYVGHRRLQLAGSNRCPKI